MFADLRLAFAIYDARLYHLVTAPFNWSTLSFSLLLTSVWSFISMLFIAHIAYGFNFCHVLLKIAIFPLPNASRGDGSLPLITNVTLTTTLQNTYNHHMVTLLTMITQMMIITNLLVTGLSTGVLHLARITWRKSVL